MSYRRSHESRWKRYLEAFLVGAALGAFAAYLLGIWLAHLYIWW